MHTYGTGGYLVTTQEFLSITQCQEAANFVIETTKAAGPSKVKCVMK